MRHKTIDISQKHAATDETDMILAVHTTPANVLDGKGSENNHPQYPTTCSVSGSLLMHGTRSSFFQFSKKSALCRKQRFSGRRYRQIVSLCNYFYCFSNGCQFIPMPYTQRRPSVEFTQHFNAEHFAIRGATYCQALHHSA